MKHRFPYFGRMVKLWKRRNGVYYALWQDHGRTRQKSLGTQDCKVANRKLNNLRRDLIAGKITPLSNGLPQTLKPFVEEFLYHVQSTKEASTHNLYTVALNKAVDAWGDIPLKHITVRHIDNLMADMARSGLSIATVNKNYRHVKAALTKGYEWYDLKPLRFPKQLPETKQVRYLTKNQLHTLIKAIDDPEFADFCWFAAYTGLRSGEILRLQWSDIDNPETGLMRISVRQKNKTESYLPINANTKAILKQCRQRGWKKPFRFTSRTSVSQMFKKAARKAGLGWYRFHDLRHTYGSHLAMAGENEAAIQKLMRHKSIVSTLIYTNLSNEYLKEASEKVNYGPREVGKNKT